MEMLKENRVRLAFIKVQFQNFYLLRTCLKMVLSDSMPLSELLRTCLKMVLSDSIPLSELLRTCLKMVLSDSIPLSEF